MDGINKYSREWFALNGNEEYTSKAENLKDGVEGLENSDSSENLFTNDKDNMLKMSSRATIQNLDTSENSKLDESLFVGDKETVINNIADYCKNSAGKTATINTLQSYGAENIFNVLDENSDGVVTEEELADMAGASTPQSADTIDTVFTLSDISNYYENAMAAKGAIVEEEGNTIKITYADGQYTELKTDENGNVYSKYYEKNIEDGRAGIEYNTQDNSKTRIYLDSESRPTKIIYDKNDETKSDYTTQYTYNDDGSKVVETETIGKKVVTQYDSLGNVTSENFELKYNSDGIIEDTKQKYEGNCWALSGINALRITEKGAEIIKNSIQQNEDGSVTVYLNGVNKSYTYTPEEVGSYKNKYNSGDVDMDILMMAIADFRCEKIANGTGTVNSKDVETFISQDATLDDPLEAGRLDEAIYYLTGIKSKYKSSGENKEKIKLLNEYLKADKSNIAATIDFKDSDETVSQSIRTKHAYSIVGADEENVYVENPWNAGTTIAYPIEKIGDNIAQISLTYLSEENKIGNFFNKISNKIKNFFKNLYWDVANVK